VVGVVVVLGMGELPREVGHVEDGVEDEADRVVEPLLRHEAAVAALVGQHPNASPGQTLVEPVRNPASPVEERVLLGEAVEVDDEEEPDGALQQIHAQIAEGFEHAVLEEMRRNGALDLAQREGGVLLGNDRSALLSALLGCLLIQCLRRCDRHLELVELRDLERLR
jgi:hypothetical protein